MSVTMQARRSRDDVAAVVAMWMLFTALRVGRSRSAERRQLPGAGSLIVPDEIRVAIRAPQFEVPVVGREPRVDYLRDGDATVSKNQRARRLLAAMAGMALDADRDLPLFRHSKHRRITILPERYRPVAARHLFGILMCST